MKIIIVAGGTGGHIYPGIAIAQALIKKDPKANILFIGSHDGIEKTILKQYGYQYKLIFSRALLRKISYKSVTAPFVSLLGLFQMLLLLRQEQPDCVLSTGGYASIAAVLAAKFYKIPVYLHEQNVFPGAVNRFCGRFARTVFLSFEESLQYIAGKVFGNPVRDEIINLPELKHEKRNVLIMGGSQGARKLNHLIVSALPLIRQDVFIYHIIGDRDYKQIMAGSQLYQFKNYQPISYDHQIASLLAKIDLTISRAGATAIAEFLVRAIPMILVPFPFAADDHQRLNAKAIEKAGAALVLEEKHLTPQIIADLVNNHGLNYAKMKQACNKAAKPDAASKIADYIYADNR